MKAPVLERIDLSKGGITTVLDITASRDDLTPKEMSTSRAIRYKMNLQAARHG